MQCGITGACDITLNIMSINIVKHISAKSDTDVQVLQTFTRGSSWIEVTLGFILSICKAATIAIGVHVLLLSCFLCVSKSKLHHTMHYTTVRVSVGPHFNGNI